MKVIFVTREGVKLSGCRVRCHGFAGELKKYGIETEVFSFADDLGACFAEEEAGMGLRRKLKLNMRALKILRRKADRGILFMQRFNYHSLAPFLISWFKKNKLIFDCDDWDMADNPGYYLGIYPSSKMEFLTGKIARYSSICIAASTYLERYLKQFNRNVYYMPTGVDTAVFKPVFEKNRGDELRFSWIGTVYHKEMSENVRFIIDCFCSLAIEYDNIFLELAGEGRYLDGLKSYVRTLKYGNRIIIKDWIPYSGIPAYLSNIDIGLIPLIQDLRFNKAKSPTKLFEYMAMGLPTVSSRIGEAENIIKDGSDGYLAESAEEFTEKMRLLIERPEDRIIMGNNARQSVQKNYSLALLGQRLHEILYKHA